MVYFMYRYLSTQAKDKIFERKKKKNQRVNIKVLTRQRMMAYLLG